MLSVVHREQRDRSQIPCLFANLANKAESELICNPSLTVRLMLIECFNVNHAMFGKIIQ